MDFGCKGLEGLTKGSSTSQKQAVIEAGCVSVLVDAAYRASDSNAYLRFGYATRALENLSEGNEDQRRVLVDAGCVELFKSKVRYPSVVNKVLQNLGVATSHGVTSA